MQSNGTHSINALSKHAIKRIVEASNLAEDMAGEFVTVQVVDVSIFEGDKAKKNIKGRVTLSDGVSKVICMLPDKSFNGMVSGGTDR